MRVRTFLPLLALLPLVLPATAAAASIAVNTEADTVANDGSCSLREAITAANGDAASGAATGECAAGSGADTITLPSGTYTRTRSGSGENLNSTGDLDVTSELTVEGADAATTTIDAAGLDRVLHIAAIGTVTLRGVTLTGGHAPDGGTGTASLDAAPATGGTGGQGSEGGGVLNAGTLTLTNVRVTDNVAGSGGDGGLATGADGLANGGNGFNATGGAGADGGRGGGISSSGPLTLTGTSVTDNLAGDGGTGGGAVSGDGGPPAVNADGGNGGTATGGLGGDGGDGGGIFSTGALTVTASTVSRNAAGEGGDGGEAVGGIGAVGNGTGDGGNGGNANGGHADQGGDGGGLVLQGAAAATIADTAIEDNAAGTSGTGGAGSGGEGRAGGTSSGTGGFGGGGNGGNGPIGGSGGGLAVVADLTMTGSTVAGNSSGLGGGGGDGAGGDGGNGGTPNGNGRDAGQGSGGSASIAGVGGGLYTDDDVTIENTTISGNVASDGGDVGSGTGGEGGDGRGTGDGGDGGAGSVPPGADGGDGGGLYLLSPVTVRHGTITGNAAGSRGGGGAALAGSGGSGSPAGSGGPALAGLAGDDGRGGGAIGNGLTLAASIIAGNAPENCVPPGITDGGDNLTFPGTSCPGTSADPKLGPLAANGGPTRTHTLGPDSAALDRVPATGAGCTATDQRGFARPIGAGCDIGALELGPPAAVTGAASAITQVAARVAGTVTTAQRPTTWFFEYGTTTAYGTRTPDADAGSGAPPADVAADLTGLTAATTYHYRLVAQNPDGTAVGEDRTFTTAPSPPILLPDLLEPRFVTASLSPAIFAVNRTGEREVAVAAQRRRRVRRGTTFRLLLTEPARVVYTIQRARSGRRAGGRCRRVTRANRRRRKCTRWVRVGRFAQQVTAARTTSKRFSGRIGRRTLRRGRHRAVLVATDAAGNTSAAKRLNFRIARVR